MARRYRRPVSPSPVRQLNSPAAAIVAGLPVFERSIKHRVVSAGTARGTFRCCSTPDSTAGTFVLTRRSPCSPPSTCPPTCCQKQVRHARRVLIPEGAPASTSVPSSSLEENVWFPFGNPFDARFRVVGRRGDAVETAFLFGGRHSARRARRKAPRRIVRFDGLRAVLLTGYRPFVPQDSANLFLIRLAQVFPWL